MEKLAELIGGLKDYFNDFVGAIVPGAVLSAGVLWLAADYLPVNLFSQHWGEWTWLPGISLIFLLGHALLALQENWMRLINGDWRSRRSLGVTQEAQANSQYKVFHELILPKIRAAGAVTELDFHGIRNIAMSISSRGADLGRRFMFISLFCYGTAAACWVIAFLDMAFVVLVSHTNWVVKSVLAAVLVPMAWLLRRRGRSFELRALTAPFSVAIAELYFVPELKRIEKH